MINKEVKNILIDTVICYSELYLYSIENDCPAMHKTIKRKIHLLQNELKEKNLVKDANFWQIVFSIFSDMINEPDKINDTFHGDNLLDLMGKIKTQINYGD